jgi:hypothetical protein
VFGETDKEELYRRLAQARRMFTPTLDPTTRERIQKLVSDLEQHIAKVEARDTDAPPE